ncbi:MAG: hypothetical protein Nk1A_7540 [Endomicrobiia bacterium]|nr:MAG: hypothetical protein Nk1A_7540 [Endomicrobiia bacterium]
MLVYLSTPEEREIKFLCVRYGSYRIIVNHTRQCGKGEFYEAYVKLKKKLEVEGIFKGEF